MAEKGAATAVPEAEGEPAKSLRIRRLVRILTVLPYFIGITWTCLHPVVSVITGEIKCRGWFLDESSIEIKFAHGNTLTLPSHLQKPLPLAPLGRPKLCDTLSNVASNLRCHSHTTFDMAMLVPLANAVDPVEEAVVYVVSSPPNGDWTNSRFHFALLQSLRHLADPQATPWLAKTFLVVAPHDANTSLQGTVDDFLGAYLGGAGTVSTAPPLPPRLSQSLLRTLIVVDIQDESSQRSSDVGVTELAVLPQGRRGVLPNMDLVFLVGKLMERALFLHPRRHAHSTFVAHFYGHLAQRLEQTAQQLSQSWNIVYPPCVETWFRDMVHLVMFGRQMVLDPPPPHATALDRGIDSLTLQIHWKGAYSKDPAVELVQHLEWLLRAVSNLHERLHHSLTLYLLPSPRKFVSHTEYLLPTLLVLLPLGVRAFSLVFQQPRLQPSVVGAAVVMFLTTMGTHWIWTTVVVGGGVVPADRHTPFLAWYLLVLWCWWRIVIRPCENARETAASLQFAACVMAVYTLVPIAFGHVSLAYLPSVLWSAVLAVPNYNEELSRVAWSLLVVVWMVTVPAVGLVPGWFPTYTPFLLLAYIPLHVQFLLLLWTTRFSKLRQPSEEKE